MKLATALINFECQPCGIFEGLSWHQEDEAIDPTMSPNPTVAANIVGAMASPYLWYNKPSNIPHG